MVTGSNSFGGNGQLYSSVVDNQNGICELTDDEYRCSRYSSSLSNAEFSRERVNSFEICHCCVKTVYGSVLDSIYHCILI